MATEKIINPTWNRKQETDADKLAVDMLVEAGRDFRTQALIDAMR